LVEVGPRDGLQNEKAIIPTEIKVAFIDALSRAGFEEIEVSSFVSPKWIPQLADAAAVFAAIERRPGIRYTALVPNEQGLDRAVQARADGVSVFTAASETFTRKNINATIAESIERLRPVVRQSPVPVRGYLSTAFHCPYEGAVSPDAVIRVAAQLIELGCAELSIGDTIGKATPDEVRRLLELLLARFRVDRIGMHFHDTYGRGVANARAGAELGVTTFDSSAGGIGGCPYAPGASGNVATEDLLQLFGAETGVDGEALRAASAVVRPYLTERGERRGERETQPPE
jgi:hydroxymethylglutaryl-CoA lyase